MDLSTQQLAVISALSTGATITSAAEQAGVHRNTINHWRRNSLPFQHALADAQCNRALLFREKIEDMVDLAIATLQSILADPDASAAVRLKAALAIITAATTTPPPVQPIPLDLAPKVHNPAQRQPSLVPPIASTAPPAQPTPHNLHNTAQRPAHRHHPEVARNASCPCGSGLKYKRCCLDKRPLSATTKPLPDASRTARLP